MKQETIGQKHTGMLIKNNFHLNLVAAQHSMFVVFHNSSHMNSLGGHFKI